MNNKFLITLFFLSLFSVCCWAEDRIKMKIPSPEEQQVQNLLERLSNSVENEDSKEYFSCFTQDLIAKNKKKIILMFMHHDMDMDISKFEIVDSDYDFVEFVTKYDLYEDDKLYKIVSSVVAKKEGEKLLISKENILSKSNGKQNNNVIEENPRELVGMQFAVRQDCPDGRCPLVREDCPDGKCPIVRQPNANPQVLPGIAMWNDENGNPNPNGVMWIDPFKLLAKFPDKYGVPPCMRAELARRAKLQQQNE